MRNRIITVVIAGLALFGAAGATAATVTAGTPAAASPLFLYRG